MRLRTGLAALPLVLVPLVACAPEDDSSGTASDDQTSSSPSEETSERVDTPTEEPTQAGLSPECAPDQLPLNAAGQLTIATDSPAYEPWFVDDDPTNGKGYESAVAYAVAEKLGFGPDQVEWTVVPFNTSYKPGDKDFDFDINQISITPGARQGRRLLRRLLLRRAGRGRARGRRHHRARPASPTWPTTSSAPRPARRR